MVHRCGKNSHWRVDCTEELCSRSHGCKHASDVRPTLKKDAVLAAFDDDDDGNTIEASTFKAAESGECSDVSGSKGEGESAWHVGGEAEFCGRGASTHMTPRADSMINCIACIMKLRVAYGATTIEGYGDISFLFRSGNGVVPSFFFLVYFQSNLLSSH